MSPKKFLAAKLAQETLEQQTLDMAHRLEEVGVPCVFPSSVSLLTDVTKQVIPLPNFRNINVLPSVAQKNRRSLLNDVAFFLENIDREYWRYAVITFGERIPAFGDLRGAISQFKEHMRKWRYDACEQFPGIEFGFVGLEFPRDADGTYHLHANVLYKTPLFFDKGAAWRAFTHRKLGTWWRDAGRIENVRELVKYPFKPNDIEGCEGDELKWLAESTFKMRIAEILGPIQIFRKQRKDRRQRVVAVGGKLRLREIGDIFDVAKDKTTSTERDEKEDKKDPFNIIVARVPPSFGTTPWAEGGTLIYNYDPDPVGQKSKDRLAEVQLYQMQARNAWDAKGCPDPETALNFAAAIGTSDNVKALWEAKRTRAGGSASYIVHNETITVPQEFKLLADQWEESVIETAQIPPPTSHPPPSEPDFLANFR